MKNIEKSLYQPKFWKPIKNEDIVLIKSVFNNFGFDKHVHEGFGIGVIGEGSIDAFIDGRLRTVNKKSIMTINPDTAHSNWSQNKNSYTQAALHLQPSFISNVVKENFNSHNMYFKTGLYENEALANEFLTLATSYENNELTELEYECKLVEITKKLLLSNGHVVEQNDVTKHNLAIFRAKEFMNDNLSDDLTLDDIAKEVDVSKYHFLRLFKEQTHFSPHAYLMLKRLEKAKRLLQKGESPISVAFACGFSDQSHLNRKFKAFVGVTAKEYQKFFI